MRRLLSLSIAILLISVLFVISASAISEADTASDAISSLAEQPNATPTWQIALVYCLMFGVIAFVGVYFLKTIKKNKQM